MDEAPPGERHGVLSAPKVDAIDVPALLELIGDRDVISYPELGKALGLGEQPRKYLIRHRLITPVAPLAAAKRSGGYQISHDEAVTLILAAVLAVAGGVAVSVTLRSLKRSGLVGDAAERALRTMADPS